MRNNKPSWRPVYLLSLLICALFLLVYQLPISEVHQKVAAIVLLLCYHGLIAGWLRLNRASLAREDDEERQRRRASRSREAPLTAVQAHFLRVMEQHKNH